MAKNNIVALVGLGALALWALAKKKKYSCYVCGLQFNTLAELKAHLAEKHEIAYPDFPGEGYHCPLCGELFATIAELEAHMVLMHPELITHPEIPIGEIVPDTGTHPEVPPPVELPPTGKWNYQASVRKIGDVIDYEGNILNTGSTETRLVTLYVYRLNGMTGLPQWIAVAQRSISLASQQVYIFKWAGTPLDPATSVMLVGEVLELYLQDNKGDKAESIVVWV